MQIDANIILNFINDQRLNWPMALGFDRRESDLLHRLERLVRREMRKEADNPSLAHLEAKGGM